MPRLRPTAPDDLPPDLKPIATFAAQHFFEDGKWPIVRDYLRIAISQGLGEIAEVERRIHMLAGIVHGGTVGISPAMDAEIKVDVAVMAQLDLPKAHQFAEDYVRFVEICAQRYNQPKAKLTLTSIELLTTLLAGQPHVRQQQVNWLVPLLGTYLHSDVERPGIFASMGSNNSFEWTMQIGDTIRYFLNVHTLTEYLAERQKLLQQNRPPVAGVLQHTRAAQERQGVTKIFLVHGHDIERRNHVKLALESMGYRVVVLSERAYAGQYTMTKFRRAADETQYAVVLLTKDDFAISKRDLDHLSPQASVPRSRLQARARQNVIWEWGYFFHKFGSRHICVLKDPDVEMFSDMLGKGYVELNAGWEERLRKEIAAAGQDEDV